MFHEYVYLLVIRVVLVPNVCLLLEYGRRVWKAMYQRNTRRLQSLQRRYTREYHSMLEIKNTDRLHSTSLYYIHRRIHRIELVMVRKSFHSKVDLGLDSLFEVAHNVGTRVRKFKLFIPVCR